MTIKPPPIIDSAKVLLFASNDEDVHYTDRIDLHVGTLESGLVRMGEMHHLAIVKTYDDESYYLNLA